MMTSDSLPWRPTVYTQLQRESISPYWHLDANVAATELSIFVGINGSFETFGFLRLCQVIGLTETRDTHVLLFRYYFKSKVFLVRCLRPGDVALARHGSGCLELDVCIVDMF